MAYWWVSQNLSFRAERAGGYLWAPIRDAGGNTPHHWATMAKVKAGDVIFSYVGQQIAAISIAKGAAYPCEEPEEIQKGGKWSKEGLRLDVVYEEVPKPLLIGEIREELLPLLPAKYSPLTRSGDGNQGYLYHLPPKAAHLLFQRLDVDSPGVPDRLLVDGVKVASAKETERLALLKSRVGQGEFRDGVIAIWGGRCCVTGLDMVDLLRASHIKPWRDANKEERLDPNNGLLLSPGCDAAFDQGYISFDTAGNLIASSSLTSDRRAQLGIPTNAKLAKVNSAQASFLDYHRTEIFRR